MYEESLLKIREYMTKKKAIGSDVYSIDIANMVMSIIDNKIRESLVEIGSSVTVSRVEKIKQVASKILVQSESAEHSAKIVLTSSKLERNEMSCSIQIGMTPSTIMNTCREIELANTFETYKVDASIQAVPYGETNIRHYSNIFTAERLCFDTMIDAVITCTQQLDRFEAGTAMDDRFRLRQALYMGLDNRRKEIIEYWYRKALTRYKIACELIYKQMR